MASNDAQFSFSSDSDDEDYVPPAPRGGAGSSKAAAPAEESDMDSATADAFYAIDAVPEYADSDVDRPMVPRRSGRVGSAGAGSSGAGPSRAGGSSSAGAGSSAAGAAAAAQPSAAALAAAAAAPAGSGARPVGNASEESAGAGTEAGKSKEGPKPAEKVVDKKQTVDDLWAEMNKPIPSSKPKTASGSGSGSGAGSSSNPKTAPADGGLGDWLSAPGPPKSSSEGASKPRALPRLEDAEASSAKTRTAPDDDEIQPAKKQKTGTGLEAALSAAKGEVAPNTLERTKAAWKDFKKDADDEVEEELEKYKKGKERYTDRVAFLGRVGRREWEVEQDGKKKR